MSIVGPVPDWMFEKGKLSKNYFTKEKLIYMDAVNELIFRFLFFIFKGK